MQTKNTYTSVIKKRAKTSVLLAIGVLFVVGVVFPGARHQQAQAATCSSSSDCLNQINNLSSANSSNQARLSDLAGQAASYEQTINQLESRISALQNQISKNEAEQASLQKQIVETEKKIAQEKTTLGDVLRSMYVDGQMSAIEMLATSNTLSDYVDKQEYRNSVQSKVQDAMAEIAALQQQLQAKQTAVEDLITTEKTQQGQVEASRAEQAKLLAYNTSQQAAYNAKIAANKKSIGSLYTRLAALNSAGTVNYSGTCGGGYPSSAVNRYGRHWGCHYGQDSTVDNWNMYNRECVSYTAWMVYKNYGYSTSGWGNAYEWISEAESHGISVSQTPQAGDVAIRDRNYSEPGDVGHAMYVVSARSSSDITVWEYNRHYDGTFDQRTFNPHDYSAPVYYLHFR